MQTLVTGATGFLGSHLVERLLARGDSVRALARATSDTSFLTSRGVDLAIGDITQPETLPAALADVEVVYHAAANVSDWGPWRDFKRITVVGTRNMLRAAGEAGVKRFLHVSSDAVYKFSDLRKGVDEETAVETRFGPLDYYRRSKTAAEKIARKAHAEGLVPVSIVRPALILGERDAAMLPAVLAFIKSATPTYIGNAKNQLPCVYAGDVAELSILAATSDEAAGEIYNAVNEEYVTQQDLFESAAETAELTPPTRHIPLRALYAIAAGMEAAARLRGWGKRPELTRFAVNLLGVDYVESNEKARSRLGWKAEVDMREAVRRSIEWARNRKRQPVSN
ncbi:MAG TPA: NAD-dependent epimerase/dehydratase family protein [Dehalococcoidia bacterium]|nr:NAD-dependent epimerase/dehydratase family protein [Dehalococcoidia bacterium]